MTQTNGYEITRHSSTSAEADKYRAILQKRIDAGTARAAEVIEHVHAHQPKDQVVRTRAVNFFPSEGKLQVGIDGASLTASDYALGQLASRAGVPTAYLRELAEPGASEWKVDLAATILARHYSNEDATQRMLARSVNGQLRGWLSDKYRRLDSRPLIDALAVEAQAVGAIPVDGTATETRCALKVILPTILEPVPGEFLVLGCEWSNSDYGNGTHSIRGFALRVACLNGMTRENMLRQVHIGGRLDETIEFSDRTYRLDTATSVSALRDTVRGALGPKGVESILSNIRSAHERTFSAKELAGVVGKATDKKTAKSIEDAYGSEDVINLPAGQTAWRASNAISWIARNTTDAEKRLDLERLAGSVAS
jgi:hypothetical protein